MPQGIKSYDFEECVFIIPCFLVLIDFLATYFQDRLHCTDGPGKRLMHGRAKQRYWKGIYIRKAIE